MNGQRVLLLARRDVAALLRPVFADHGDTLVADRPDWIVTAYWPRLLAAETIASARCGTVNLHPSLLPVNRGWYPYVHNILDGSPAGVTLHELADRPDAGRIWAQRPVRVLPTDTASTLYRRLQAEIVALFRDAWPDIAAGRLKPWPQDESRAVYHARAEVLGEHMLDADAPTTAREVIRRLRAHTFGGRGYAGYVENGRKIFVHVRLDDGGSADAQD